MSWAVVKLFELCLVSFGAQLQDYGAVRLGLCRTLPLLTLWHFFIVCFVITDILKIGSSGPIGLVE